MTVAIVLGLCAALIVRVLLLVRCDRCDRLMWEWRAEFYTMTGYDVGYRCKKPTPREARAPRDRCFTDEPRVDA